MARCLSSHPFLQIKEGLLKGEDYTEKQPDGEDDGVDALVSVTVPPQSRSHTQFLQFHFSPEYKKKYPDLFMAANNYVAQGNRNYRSFPAWKKKKLLRLYQMSRSATFSKNKLFEYEISFFLNNYLNAR